MKKSKSTAYVVPHTHWDREWRYPIWKSRMLLVEFMDELLEVLENEPDYHYFHMDGQVVMVEDYLDIRPEKKEKIAEFVKQGRLGIGPFYTLPDLYPVDAECIVRNIKKGIETCREYGGHVPIGYHSFGWGQISQFPQIYHDLGFEFLIVGKHVSKERAGGNEFLWEAPDGSRILTSRLGQYARSNFYFNAYILIRHGAEYFSDNFKYQWGNSKSAIHDASHEKQNHDYFTVEASAKGIHAQFIGGSGMKAWEGYSGTFFPDKRLIMDGSDFSYCQPVLPDIIKELNGQSRGIEFRISSLTGYYHDIRPEIDHNKLSVVRGELRDGGPADCTANALTTRMYLKILNRKAQNLLIKKAEPLAALTSCLGNQYVERLFKLAWDFLFKAQAHDSINGVTQDKTADDVEYHLKQVVEIAETLIDQSVGFLINRIGCQKFQNDDILILCINPLPFKVREVRKIVVDLPRDRNIWDFHFSDANGQMLEVQPLGRKEHTSVVFDPDSRSWPFYHDRHELYLDSGEIPAGGYKILRLEPGRKFNREVEWWPLVDISRGNDISPGPGILENEHLSVALEHKTGTIHLTVKADGKEYPGLHYFIDEGDNGDYWVYYPPYRNKVYDSRNAIHRSWISENGSLAATLVVETTMELPAHGIHANKRIEGDDGRSSQLNTLVILSEFTLKRNDNKLFIRTTINNSLEDHRLRLLLPAGIRTETSSAAGHFIVENRPVEPTRADDGTFYPGMQTLPMQEFVDVTDGINGFAVITNSIGEFEMMRDPDHTLALTLFRSVGNRICSEYRSSGYFPEQKGGQCLREMVFEYAIIPHKSNWKEGEVFREALAFNTPPLYYQFAPVRNEDGLPIQQSLYTVEPANLIVSAFYKADKSDSIIVRIFNPADETFAGKIKFSIPVREIFLVNMLEENIEALVFSSDCLEYEFEKAKIRTFRITFHKIEKVMPSHP